MLKPILLTLVASSLVAAQTVPSLTGDCVSQCSDFINSIDSCADATDYSCYCNVYEKTLPGSCINCWNSADPGTGQGLQELLSYCQSGAYSSFTISGDTSATETTGPTATAAAGTTGTTAAGETTGTASSTAKATGIQHSSASTTVVGMGLVGLVMMLGAAML